MLINNIEEERAVLGCILADPSCLDEVASVLSADEFYELKHQNLFNPLVGMADEQIPIDPLSVRNEAKMKLGAEEMIGGIAYLADLRNRVPSAAHLPYALKVLARKTRLRKLQDASFEIQKVLGSDGDDDEKLEKIGCTLTSLLQCDKGGEATIKDIARDTLEQIQAAFEHTGECTGIATGFHSLDRLTTGLHGGEYIILAARPSMGKTSLAMCIAEHVALESDTAVGFLSLEMKSTALMLRTFSSLAEIDGRDLRSGSLTKHDLARLPNVFGKIANSKLHIDDSSGISITEAAARIRRMVSKHGCKMVIVDYIQLIHGSKENRVQEVAQVSQQLKALAIQLDIPILCLSQLNRAQEQQNNRSPRLSDLRDSGSLEQDADQVWFLYREDASNDETILNIAKNRNGPCHEIELEFQAKFTRYVNPRAPQFERPKHPDFELSHA